jgi:ketopantoate reductase
MLHHMLPESLLVGRVDAIPKEHPIIVATRCDDLDDVVARVDVKAREKMIFVQNGMLHSWLTHHGLEEATQALLYVAVSHKGATPVDGGRTVVTGPYAEFFRLLLSKGDLHCRAIKKEDYQKELVEKFVWNCGFGLLCSYFSCSVGEVVGKHRKDAERLLWELAQDTADLLGSSIERDVCERLCAYSLSIASYQGSVKEWEWRNGWLWSRKQGSEHERYLRTLDLLP